MSAMFTSAIYQLFLWILSSLTLDWILWDDYTHLDLSQCTLNKTVLHVAATYLKSETACTLNKTVLHVAATYLKSETATCLRFFLSLVSKACQWCVKHLKMTLTPTGESEEEEHASLFFQWYGKKRGFSESEIGEIRKEWIEYLLRLIF